MPTPEDWALRRVSRARRLLRPYCWVVGHRWWILVHIKVCSRCLKVER